VFHSYTMFLSNLHLHSLSQLHCLPLSTHTCIVSALSRLCLHLYKKEEPWQQPMCSLINANQLLQEKSHSGWKRVDKFATNLHLGKIFPSNPRDQSMLPLMCHMALHPEGAQHREMLTKSKQCWNLIPETHFVSMSAGLSAVPIFCSRISPSSTISRTK